MVGAWVKIRLGVGVRPYEWGTLGVVDPGSGDPGGGGSWGWRTLPGAKIWVEAAVGVVIRTRVEVEVRIRVQG